MRAPVPFRARIRAVLLCLACLFWLGACSDSGDERLAVAPDPAPMLPFAARQPLPLLALKDPYDLPAPLVMAGGQPVTSAEQWWFRRRPEILDQFASQVYGRVPQAGVPVAFEVREQDFAALGGSALRRQVRLWIGEAPRQRALDVLMYLPGDAKGPVPVFLLLNFMGNHTVHPDPAVFITDHWVPNSSETGVTDNIALAESRGVRQRRFPVDTILRAGYGLVTAYYGDLDPDFDDGFKNGIHPLFYPGGQTVSDGQEWGAVSAWAWGLSRIMDYLETDIDVDSERVVVAGHSRLGKAALWAGARDTRFAMVISNNSGAVGAALSRRGVGESVRVINKVFPHWFADNFVRYGDNESLLPVDQHQLIALVAPRPVYVASADEDFWADPLGEFESLLYAADVYRLLGREGLSVRDQPPVGVPVMDTMGYHLRMGGHDLTLYDWGRFIEFADRRL